MSSALAGANEVEGIEAGIDWLTFTAGAGDDWEGLGRIGQGIVGEQESRGSRVSPVTFQGYRGWGADQCAYGFRKDSAYLRLSGSMAASYWREVSSFTGCPTRLDVQTTVLLKQPDKSYGGRWWQERQGRRYRQRGRPQKRTYSVGNEGLWIGTVGTRISRSYVRVYDKGVEAQTHPSGMRWRFELEAKRDLSRSLWQSLIKAADVAPWAVECCRSAARSASCLWPLEARGTPAPLPPVPERQVPSVESTLLWLRSSVAPSVERLLVAVDVEVLLQALGLDAYALPITANREKQ